MRSDEEFQRVGDKDRPRETTGDGRVVAVCISEERGTRKKVVDEGLLMENYGFKGDAHSGNWSRQVSLLAMESIQKMKDLGLEVGPGDFAENITTEGIDLLALPIGSLIKIGEHAVIEITQHGKTCHTKCEIYKQVGKCVMPTEGIFGKVLVGGIVKPKDPIRRIDSSNFCVD